MRALLFEAVIGIIKEHASVLCGWKTFDEDAVYIFVCVYSSTLEDAGWSVYFVAGRCIL